MQQRMRKRLKKAYKSYVCLFIVKIIIVLIPPKHKDLANLELQVMTIPAKPFAMID